MRHLCRVVPAFLAVIALGACSKSAPGPKNQTVPPPHTAPAPPPPDNAPPPPPPQNAPPPPPPKAAVSELRTNGDLGARHERIVDEAKKGGHEIAFIGDSITEGWAGAGKQAWESTWGPKHAINCGIGGDRTQHVLGRLDHGLLDALAADNNHINWVVLLIGTNNIGGGPGGDSAEDVAYGVHSILGKLRERLPHAQVVLMAVFPRGQWPNPSRDAIASLNARLVKMASSEPQRIHWLDINGKFLAANGELPKELMPDFLHLSPAGYKIWSEGLEGVLK